MTKKEKVEFVIHTLKEIYPKIPIPLDHSDPYTLLIAVLMSAQSTDVRVNKITPLLFAKAKTPEEMIKLSERNKGDYTSSWIITNEVKGYPWTV